MGLGISVAVDNLPDGELSAAISATVSQRLGDVTRYRLRYPLEIAEGELPLLGDGRVDVGSALSVLAPTATLPVCLVKGPVTGHQFHMNHGGGENSWLDVIGADSSVVMDRENKVAVWPEVADSDAVTAIVAGYGFVPEVSPTAARHLLVKHPLLQRATDLGFVRKLARRNGFYFHVSCNPLGIETAHFKRPELMGLPAADLIINLADPNIDEIELSFDVERPTSISGAQLDLNALSEIDGAVAASPLKPLGKQDLAAITGDTRAMHLAAPADDSGDLAARGEGALIEAGWFIRATCRTSLNQLGKVVAAGDLVNLRGLGKRHSGHYLVAAAHHTIDAAAHRMDLTLIRNAWGA